MQEAIEQFRANIERVRNLGALAQTLNIQTTAALDFSDILRAELVLAVSALDHFVHEMVRLGMIDTYRGNRQRTPHFERFQVSISSVSQAFSAPANVDWLEQEIRSRHGHRSFQRYDNIADAIRLISDTNLWTEVAHTLGMNSQDIRTRLDLISNRRNQIAHEADMDPSYPNRRWPIDAQMVDTSVDFIEQITEAMYAVV